MRQAAALAAGVEAPRRPRRSEPRALRASRRRALRASTRQAGEQCPPFRAQRDLHDHVAAHLDFSPQPEATKVLAGGRKPIAKCPTVAWPHARRGHPDAQRRRHSLWARVGRLIAPPGAPARAPGNLQRCLAGLPGPLRRRLRALAPVWPHDRQPAAHPRRRRRAPLRGRDAGARCATPAAPRRARPILRSGSPPPAQPRYLRNGRPNPAKDRAARQAERARRRLRHRTAWSSRRTGRR